MWLIVIAALAGEANMVQPSDPEAARAIEARFQRIDRDRNGFITANEAPRISSPQGSGGPASWMESYDLDRDSRVSPAEYVSRTLAGTASATVSLSQR